MSRAISVCEYTCPACKYIVQLLYRLFTEQEVNEIWSTTIKDVIVGVTSIRPQDIQDDPFFFNPGIRYTTLQL